MWCGEYRPEAGCRELLEEHDAHTVCARTLGRVHMVQWTMEVCELPLCLCMGSRQEATWHFLGLQNFKTPKTPAVLGGRLETPGGPQERPLAAGPPLSPTWMKVQRLDCFSWGTSHLPCCSCFSSMFVGRDGSY